MINDHAKDSILVPFAYLFWNFLAKVSSFIIIFPKHLSTEMNAFLYIYIYMKNIKLEEEPWLFFAYGQSIWNMSMNGEEIYLQKSGLQKVAMIDLYIKVIVVNNWWLTSWSF